MNHVVADAALYMRFQRTDEGGVTRCTLPVQQGAAAGSLLLLLVPMKKRHFRCSVLPQITLGNSEVSTLVQRLTE